MSSPRRRASGSPGKRLLQGIRLTDSIMSQDESLQNLIPAALVVFATSGVLAIHALGLGSPYLGIARVAAVVVAVIAVRLQLRRPKEAEMAIGAAALGLVHVAIGATGGIPASPVHALVYVLLALAAGLFKPRAAITTIVLAAATEITCFAFSTHPFPPAALLAHLGLISLFSSMFAVLLQSEARLIEKRGDEAVRDALERIEQDAEDFRLIGASLGPESLAPRDSEEIQLARQVGSVRAIRESLVDVLEVVRLAVKADAALLFMLNDSDTKLKLKECVTKDSERTISGKVISSTEGALGAVVKTRRSVNLKPRDAGGLGYCSNSEVAAFLAVPVMDGRQLVGVLAVDRHAAEAFTEADEELLDAVSREAQRAMESERIFMAMDRVKFEQERLYEAFALLNEALSLDLFGERLLEAALRVKKLDFACVTLFDAETKSHTIVGVRAEDERVLANLKGATFTSAEGGLVAMALKNGHRLPYVPLCEQSERAPLVLFGEIRHPDLTSVKVFPLLDRASPMGALILGSMEPGEDLSREEQRTVDVVCSHAAVTLSNARMYAKMEMMATRDGLTGLVNRRRFGELLTEALARATRFERKVSVMMVDADHFKTVNDTYGHPVGDLVLQRIAASLMGEARRTDVVARYGGEEFIVILDETDEEGAAHFAERVRARIENEVVVGDFGRVRVTVSLGIACFPDHSMVLEELLERADQALYEAKKKGRNRVVICRAANCALSDRPAIRPAERGTQVPSSPARN